MKDLNNLEHFEPLEKLTQIICNKSQNNSPHFFRLLIAYNFSKVASMMRANVSTLDRGIIPINMYVINLANSGFGKGLSTNIIEQDVMGEFQEKFLDDTLPAIAERSLAKVAIRRSIKKNTDQDEELELVKAEYENLGAFPFSYDSGTTPAFKQLRYKCLLSGAGSLNLQIDEIGSNLLANTDLLGTYLETFDQGLVKQKLVKNTKENVRGEDIAGKVPANLMLFGTPAKVFNDSKQEEEYNSMQETGFARRCFFGLSTHAPRDSELTPEEIFNMLTDVDSSAYLDEISEKVSALADPMNFNTNISVSKEVSLLLIEYRLYCENISDKLPDHEDTIKSEIAHRYFKVLKLAGAYAFIDGSHEVTEGHTYSAIKLAEESGKSFRESYKRDRAFVKLAKYLGATNKSVTAVDLTEDLPFYKGTESAKKEMMTLAIAYGYSNNICITRKYIEDIEFFKGSMLEETDVDKMILSYSTDITTGYRNDTIKFDSLHKLVCLPDYHWVAKHLIPKEGK